MSCVRGYIVALAIVVFGLAGCAPIAPSTPAAPTNEAAEKSSTLEADQSPEPAARAAFEIWAATNGEPYRDAQFTVLANDGYFSSVQVIAWFRPSRTADWEEREVAVECRLVGAEWQCDQAFEFTFTAAELARRGMPTELIERFGMEFVYVPPGEFTMGSSEADVDAALELCNSSHNGCERAWFENEVSQHQVDLDGYWIGKTEVTNAQYQAFVDAGGYDDASLWTEAGWDWRQSSGVSAPFCWNRADFNQPEQPVICIGWYEAVAYANWLARETGLDIRLPSEAEWEKAARGTDARIWPWGNDAPDGTRLNACDVNCVIAWADHSVDDGYTGIAPVGSYPDGASPYGALDMAGNVYEWTSTAWGGCEWPGPGTYAYPYQADDGREGLAGTDCRVVRGGSWAGRHMDTRAAHRVRLVPDFRNVSVGLGGFGFRLVAAPSQPGN